MNRSTLILSLLTLVVIIGVVLATKVYSRTSQPTTSTSGQLIRADSPHQGSASARVTLVEFGDYQCPACGTMAPVVQQLQAQEGSDLQLIWRNFPLPMHQHAWIAAQSAEAAGLQGKYWQMHDLLYGHQEAWAEQTNAQEILEGYAHELGLNLDQFRHDRDSGVVKQKIQRDLSDAEALQLSGTPTFFINNQPYAGGLNATELKAAIDAAKH